jgi:hypothetical protein
MSAIRPLRFANGLAATAIVQLRAHQPITTRPIAAKGDDVVLAAVQYPPRTGDVRPIASLLPQVLARYGLPVEHDAAYAIEPTLDVDA